MSSKNNYKQKILLYSSLISAIVIISFYFHKTDELKTTFSRKFYQDYAREGSRHSIVLSHEGETSGSDVVHEDVVHEDVAHKDVAHKDVVHKDVVHKDVVHKDAVHEDVVHEDVVHEDVVHKDVVPEVEISLSHIGKKLGAIDCTMWRIPKTWKGDENPQIVLNPKRFLYPGLLYGPNNQISGLKEAIYMAIVLNRTLAIPMFRSHYTSSGRPLSSFQMIDLARLCSFISCIADEDLRKKCNGSFDVAFQIAKRPIKSYRNYEDESQMSIFHHNKKAENLTYLPYIANLNLNERFSDSVPQAHISVKSADLVRKEYKSDLPCAIAPSLFWTIPQMYKTFVPNRFIDLNDPEIARAPDEDLNFAISNALRLPPCIVDAADRYVREVLNDTSFIGIHWRYDEKDFGKRNCNTSGAKAIDDICKVLMKLHPSAVVSAFKTFRESESAKGTKTSIPVYLAAPPNANNFRKQFNLALSQSNGMFVEAKISLKSFLAKKMKLCWEAHSAWQTDIAHTISLCEMAIMVKSSWFFFSPLSTWSDNIRPHRVEMANGEPHKKFEQSIIDFLLENLNKTENADVGYSV